MPSLLAYADMAAGSLAGVLTQQVERLSLGCALMCVSKRADGLCPWLCLVMHVTQKEFGLGCALRVKKSRWTLPLAVPCHAC